ncbi:MULTISPECIES: hypothetical protein [unclassified Microbacterium]|uniref:hypothetical protein n=1 Tax=unclassified Microbacterium TaxID=2609290 RepID=UPI003015D416
MQTVDEGAAGDAAPRPRRPPRRRRRSLGVDLAALTIVGVLLAGALTATGIVLYRDLYSPSAFVSRYLDLLSHRQAAEALALPGVSVDSSQLRASGLPVDASEALLRRDALGQLTDATVEDAVEGPDGITTVTVRYSAGPHEARTRFQVERAGWVGVAPTWRFASSPLAAIDLTVRGARQFSVNGFEVDTRQVSPAGVNADPLVPVSLLVFSPGLYSISIDTPIAATPGVAVLSDTPQASIPVDVEASATEKFRQAVQDQVETFLTACATQDVLQPTGCPFGLVVQNRIVSPPTWSMVQQPEVALVPEGADWRIQRAAAAAHIDVEIRSIYDGSVRHLDEAVPFFIGGTVTILPDGTASIQVTDGS